MTNRPFEIGLFTSGDITADPVTGQPIDPAVRLRELIDLTRIADDATGHEATIRDIVIQIWSMTPTLASATANALPTRPPG